ncbi:signal peptidase I [Paenibacillus lemnae]|uniref:Signal peptidase I n=1 Tax=Paenibacillus lemnae TaxID=1330551 RepID=A0A848M2A6_PAELE|nr:signal peptidase I [Paenibacillus lemnae]
MQSGLEQVNDKISENSPAVSEKSTLWGWVKLILIIGAVYLVVNNITGLDRVSGNSMNPTLQNGDVLVLNKWSLLFKPPQYGDVVIVHEEELGYSIVKRVIGVDGDRVRITDGITYVNGTPLSELYTYGTSEDVNEVTVGDNELFVVGDNRNLGESLDSRDPGLGPVHISSVKAYVWFSLWPMHGIAKPLDL